ncbi:retrovirus-related pol polyprotein from transposon TNT 1-94 [Tanacetum coccineum]
MNVRAKSASKKNKKRKEWKPTGKVFNSVGYKWKPTGRTFTLVGNACPLTRRPKVPKSVPNSKPKVAQSMAAKRMEPGTSQDPNTISFSYYPSSLSLIAGRVVNWEKYILVIVDDYSRFTWVKFLASKDEAPDFIIKFLKMIQIRLNATVRNIRTDNRTEFVNQTLRDYYEQVGISHETSVARTPQQNGVVERQNRTLVEDMHQRRKPYYRIYNKNVPENSLETIHVDFDELMAMASEQSSLELALHEITPATPMFDEFFSPSASVASPVPVVKAPAPVESTSSPSSASVDQDAPSPSTSQTSQQ